MGITLNIRLSPNLFPAILESGYFEVALGIDDERPGGVWQTHERCFQFRLVRQTF